MKITPTALSEVKLIEPLLHEDERGHFFEAYKRSLLAVAGIAVELVQDNQSYSKRKGTIRGLHFQAPPYTQAKVVRVLHGAIFEACVDARRGSPTYGQHVTMELSADDKASVFVPGGFLHGLCTLEDDTVVLYKVSSDYREPAQGGIRWNDPDLAIDWPVSAQDAIVSERDKNHPLFADFESPFLP